MKTIEKILAMSQSRGTNQSDIAKAAGVAPSRVTDWKKDEGKPTLEQALRLARFFDVPLEYLADDSIESMPVSESLGEAEQAAVDLIRALRLTKDEALRRISSTIRESDPLLDAKVEFVNELKVSELILFHAIHGSRLNEPQIAQLISKVAALILEFPYRDKNTMPKYMSPPLLMIEMISDYGPEQVVLLLRDMEERFGSVAKTWKILPFLSKLNPDDFYEPPEDGVDWESYLTTYPNLTGRSEAPKENTAREPASDQPSRSPQTKGKRRTPKD
jgi:transcriptional regulator with XRE-family HTH domain